MSVTLAAFFAKQLDEVKELVASLESLSGYGSADIRLTSRIAADVRKKIAGLNLDPDDTSPEELYEALKQKLAHDEKQLIRYLRTQAAVKVNAEADINDGLKCVLEELAYDSQCLSLKNSSLNRMMKKYPPKKTMKSMGFKSIDSMLKHNPAALILMALNLHESKSYLASFYSEFKKCKYSDFELKPINLIFITEPKWQKAFRSSLGSGSSRIVASYELSSLIIYPFQNTPGSGELISNFDLALDEMTRIASASAYLRLHLLDAAFGEKVYNIVASEEIVAAELGTRPIPWHLVQSNLHNLTDGLDLIHVNLGDLCEKSFKQIFHDSVGLLSFWHDSEHLGYFKENTHVSLNLSDLARDLYLRNGFSNRISSGLNVHSELELLKSYLEHPGVLRALKLNLSPQLLPETATIE